MATNTTSPAAPSSLGIMFIFLLAIILLSVAMAVGLPGNGFVVWSILVKMQKRSVTALMVLNLALADLAVLLTAPFFLHFLAQRTWIFGVAGCRLFHYICGVSMYASVLLIMAMSLDRSLAVARPFVSQKLRTKTMAWRVLAGIWVLSALLPTPVIVYRTVIQNNRSLVCASKYSNERHRAFHLLFETFTGFLLPFLVVVASYSDIGRRLQARRFRRSRRTSRLVVLIILTFAAFWLPYHLVNLAEASRALAGRTPQSGPVGLRLSLARKVLIALAFLSSSVNPVLYACAGGSLLRSVGVGFVAKLLEATGSEVSSTRRGGTLNQTVRSIPASPDPGATEGLTDSTNPLDEAN
ncbi:leukotriene B4 receptor 1 [Rousettus aegyptiacus]|uniref:Leukotriene B4 receptor n=1 Tax=Rousettus aegyptiacus TaxID=9407 RepID=A0A7J8IMD7_ROUAE|nr:leukotriene B4 receptor 1 [Rousettus aegyptiacus]XP_015976052.2 leukotriene B4 receptor 1 [Rousettus aegyptiacus]KAF6485763.1 leukotriene B4 receptor [Rousettus aegyptiacus]